MRAALLGLMVGGIGARALAAQGGPPLETDDPGTPGAGRLELNVSAEAQWEGSRTLYDAPRLDANLGVGRHLQLKLEVPWRVATAPASPASSGMGNVTLGVKWRFAESGPVAVSTYPQVTLSGSERSQSKGLADSGTTLFMPVEIAWVAGPVALNAEVGYQAGPGTAELVYGLALAHQANPSLELLGECHGGGEADLSHQGVLCGAGFRWEPLRALCLLLAFTTAVAGSADDRADHRLYSGVQLRW